MTDLAECWLGYFREGYRIFDDLIKSFEAKTVKIKPKRHKRLCIIPPRLLVQSVGSSGMGVF